MKQSWQLIILLFILGSIWGSGPVIGKYAMSHGVTPLGYTFWQFIGPALLLTLIAKFQGSLQLSKQHLPYYFTCGLLGIAIPNTVYHICIPHLPSGLMPVILNTVPIIVYPLALLAKQEVFNKIRFLAILIGLFGIMLLLLPKVHLQGNDTLSWILLALISPLCFAITAIFINPYKPSNTSAISLAAGMLMSAAVILIPILILTGTYYPLTLPLEYADYVIFLRICLSSLGYVIFFVIIQHAGSVYYSLVCGIVIMNGLFWGYVIHDETVGFISILAITFIFIAILIMNSTNKKVAA